MDQNEPSFEEVIKNKLPTLLQAVLRGDVIAVKNYLQHGGDPSAKSISGTTALHHASLLGHAEISEILLKYMHMCSADVDARDKDGCSSLHLACDSGNVNVVSVLLHHGAKWDITDKHGHTPLTKTVLKAREAASERLRYQNTTAALLQGRVTSEIVNSELPTLGCTPLQLACKMNLHNTVVKLLRLGSDCAIFQNLQHSPLYLAVDNGCTETVRCLLKCNADPNITSNNSFGVLYKACSRGNPEIVEELLKYGADTELYKREGSDHPAHVAIDFNHAEAVRVLLEHGASSEVLGSRGETLLQAACAKEGCGDIVKVLVDHGAELEPSQHQLSSQVHEQIIKTFNINQKIKTALLLFYIIFCRQLLLT